MKYTFVLVLNRLRINTNRNPFYLTSSSESRLCRSCHSAFCAMSFARQSHPSLNIRIICRLTFRAFRLSVFVLVFGCIKNRYICNTDCVRLFGLTAFERCTRSICIIHCELAKHSVRGRFERHFCAICIHE